MNYILINGKINENNISSLIRKLNFVFNNKEKQLPNQRFLIDMEYKDFTSIAAIVIYKVFAYAMDNSCFYAPQVNITVMAHLFSKFQLEDLISSYFYQKDRERIYASITPVVKEDFFIAPHPLSKDIYANTDQLTTKYYKVIENYYSTIDKNIVDCIKTCMVEISSNFYSHTTDDKSIIMAEGDKNSIEILSVDTSEGIVETLKGTINSQDKLKILKKAFERNISSKKDKGHCGTGLWLVNQIVTKFKGKLIVHTGELVYKNMQGKCSIFVSNNWKGTILYAKLPINEISHLEDFMEHLFANQKKYV
jgi:hypothetical protein